jgi:hypothetical protein
MGSRHDRARRCAKSRTQELTLRAPPLPRPALPLDLLLEHVPSDGPVAVDLAAPVVH